jgi:SAM-dependent methyltransferase
MTSIAWIDKKLYPTYADNWDDTLFRRAVLDHVNNTHTLLDLGAGAGIVEATNFRGLAREVIGVDPDPRVVHNKNLDRGIVGLAEKIPLEDASCDIVVCDNVLEHLPQPIKVFREVSRVLKPGGLFIAKTPNKYHYMPIIASMTPQAFHEWFNAKRGRKAEDTFPTLYRANSAGAVTRLARESGLEVANIRRIEGRPEYLRFSALTYAVAAAYERIVNSAEALAFLRVVLLATLRKPLG